MYPLHSVSSIDSVLFGRFPVLFCRIVDAGRPHRTSHQPHTFYLVFYLSVPPFFNFSLLLFTCFIYCHQVTETWQANTVPIWCLTPPTPPPPFLSEDEGWVEVGRERVRQKIRLFQFGGGGKTGLP